jgi:hypothetical protein
MQAPGVGSDAFNFRYVEALQAFQKGEAQAPQRLVEAMEGTDPSQIQNAEGDWVLDIAVPQMDVLFRLLDNDTDAFNTALEKAVKAHKTYWSKKKNYRHRDPKGFISVPLTGLCAYAFERDVPIEVESDYIPRELYSGEYL